MNYRTSFTLSLIASCLAISGFSASRAETTETTQTTTLTTSVVPLTLSPTGSYVVVDPITGAIRGTYDPVAKLADGNKLQSGLIIVDRTNGGLVATVDSVGNIVDVGVAPASKTLVVSIDTRRQDLNRRIEEALNKGVLTPTQASVFRTELGQIAADEDSARGNAGVLSYRKALILGYGLNTLSEKLVPITHTVGFEPVIAPQFVTVDGRLIDKDVSLINQKRSRIGIRVN